MLKALEILKDIQDSKWCGVKPTLVNWKLEDFNEAIAELEEIENRSCSSCRYFVELDNHPDKDGYCDNRNIGTYSLEDEDGIALDVDKDFCCNKWDSKKWTK